jgi:hypothetical protein
MAFPAVAGLAAVFASLLFLVYPYKEESLLVRAFLSSLSCINLQEVLGERIRQVLDDCWERRDSSGGIADPHGNTGIF